MRVMLLSLKFQGAETLAVWMRFLEQNLDLGHDGKATGFNKATLKLVS